MDLGLQDARVIITGGASHIGRTIVLGFAAEGARIALVDKDEVQANRTAEEARAAGAALVTVVPADLTIRGAAEQAMQASLEALDGVDVLINNLGSNRSAFFLDTPPESWDELIHLNLSSCMWCMRAVLPLMQAQGSGAIVATASTAAFGEPRQGVYGAAKAGVISIVRSIALEYGRYGIRANLVAPGLVLPEDDETMGEMSLWRDRDAVMNEDQITYVKRNTPLRRLSRPEDIANAVLFLASDRTARQLTGQMLTVSGGFAMR